MSMQESRDDSLITLIVGPEKEHIMVAQAPLLEKVAHFRNAIENGFLESQTKTFMLPDDEPWHFHCLVRWVGGTPVPALEPGCEWIWLSMLWRFGEKYHIDNLQNEIIDTMHAKFAANHSGINIAESTLKYVVQNTSDRSPLRRFFVDMLTNGISLQHLHNPVPKIPKEFLEDMFIHLKTAMFLNDPSAISLLTRPIDKYYSSSAHCKATAMPAWQYAPEPAIALYCECASCPAQGAPFWASIWICTEHNVKFCEDCVHGDHDHQEHHMALIAVTSRWHSSSITGNNVRVIDGRIVDGGFYCCGPACDPEVDQYRTLGIIALISGERYHCLQCEGTHYCTLCMRGELECKRQGHEMLRIGPTFAERNLLAEVPIKVRQARARDGECLRCGVSGHGARDCRQEIGGEPEEVREED